MIYTYRKNGIILRFLLYFIFIIFMTLFFILYPSGILSLLFLLILYFYAFVLLSPFFTHHSLTRDWLILRHGLAARIEIPLKNIESCRPYTGSQKRLRTGVYSPWKEKALYIMADSKSAAITLQLAEPMKVPAVLWKQVDSVVFDLDHRDIFLKNLRAQSGCSESASDEGDEIQ